MVSVYSFPCLSSVHREDSTHLTQYSDSKTALEALSRIDILMLGCVYLPLEKRLGSGNLMIERNMLNWFGLL